jgi:hypothetical protein
MPASRYTKEDLDREAKAAIKGLGRFLRWELMICDHGVVQLAVYYVCRDTDTTWCTREYRLAI